MSAEVVPGAGSMPRRARHLIPTQLPRRGEVVAAFAVLMLLSHLLFAQLTLVLAAGPGGDRAGLDAGNRAEDGGRRVRRRARSDPRLPRRRAPARPPVASA